MIEFKKGDIFAQETQAIVNPVNCVGIMGKGLAWQFKEKFPDNYFAYKQVCENRQLVPGKLLITDTGMKNPTYIVNFPTKRHWKNNSIISDIDLGLRSLIEDMLTLSITSIAIPALGCGNGGLSWKIVKPLIESRLDIFRESETVRIIILEP
jgi:O-acetyl-ADP-ribose deacetylase (regulator of RNase III)